MSEARVQLITERLTKAFSPSKLEVIDECHLHIGHAGAENGAGHYAVVIQSDAFKGLIPIKAHRLIYQELDDLIPHEIHALKIKCRS